MNVLKTMHCQPMDGQAPMNEVQISAHLARVPGWTLVDGAIQKTFRFDDFHRTMAFVNALAWIAHREDHHPDLQLGYNRCTVRYGTHAVGGISVNDFICAARADALISD